MREQLSSHKKIIITVLFILLVAIILVTIWSVTYITRASDPLPPEVMTTASDTHYSDLWLKYLSRKDALGSPEQFSAYLKKHSVTEREFALNTLKLILNDSGESNVDNKAEECLKENFK